MVKFWIIYIILKKVYALYIFFFIMHAIICQHGVTHNKSLNSLEKKLRFFIAIQENFIMSKIREEFVRAAINRAYELIDTNIYDNFHKQFELIKQRALADELLTKDERTEVIRRINKHYDRYKILYNEGTKRICENCNQECLATTFCELCVRNYLKANFSNWTSGNDNIDNLLQTCQMKTLMPSKIVEWIPYDNLQNIKYLTEGGFSKIYTAKWIDGEYLEWDSKKQQ